MAASISSESIDQDFATSMTDISMQNQGPSPNQNGEFTNVSLENVESPPPQSKKKRNKVPRKIIHFSDGILEEYSTDEETEIEEYKPPPVDPKRLSWFPWIWYHISHSAISTLGYADICGEKLAWFFGITSPKYQSAIDEFHRMKAEEEEERKELEREAQAAQQNMERAEAGLPDVSVKNNNSEVPVNSQDIVVDKY